MTDEQILIFEKMAKRYSEKINLTPETAMKALIDEGILLENGKIAPEYGGDQP